MKLLLSVVSFLLLLSDDKKIKIWDVATGACFATLEGHEDAVGSIAVLEGGKLASGSYDGKIKIWDSAFQDIRR